MDLEACLPAALRTPDTTITRIAAGLSGAGVYRVDAGGAAYVLKIAADRTSEADWQRALAIHRNAADAGIAPRIHHVDEARRAVLSAFVVDHRFAASYANPATREVAIARLGELVRRVQALPIPADAEPSAPRAFGERVWRGLTGFAVPAFARDVIERVLAEASPPADRAHVLAHNDLNPTNLVDAGDHLVLLDWDTAASNDAYYDLAAIAVFLIMDDATCLALLAAAGLPCATLPVQFAYQRRLVATLCGTLFMHLARTSGHAGATEDDTLDATLALGDLYPRLRAGTFSAATADGQWPFGLALLKAASAL